MQTRGTFPQLNEKQAGSKKGGGGKKAGGGKKGC